MSVAEESERKSEVALPGRRPAQKEKGEGVGK